MDAKFPPEGQNPFQKPYQPSAPGAEPVPGIKPFTAVDLAPSPGPGIKAHAAPAMAPSPFLEAAPSKPAPAKAPASQEDFTPVPEMGGIRVPVASPIDFSPAPAAANPARKSQIISLAEMDRPAKPDFFVTTTPKVDGFTIQDYLGLVSVEVVVPKDLLFRNPAPHGELHRLRAAEDELQKVKVTALEELSGRAKALGADGIVGVTLQFSQFDTIVCLCSAVGTAVKLVG